MGDRSLNIWLIVLFGLSGITVLLLTWVLPILASERFTATLAGLSGLFIASARSLMLRRSAIKTDNRTSH